MAEALAAPDDWVAHMRRGDWEGAWELCDRELPRRAREPCWHWPRHLQYVWTGAPLAGRRVLVRCYHGLGDTIQFARYLPMLGAVAAEVTVWVPPKLLPLLRGVEGIDRLLPLHDGAPDAAFDVDVEIMELAHVFRSTPATVPAPPYLRAEPASLPRDGRPAVGVVWRGGDWNRQRSIPFALLAPLRAVRQVQLFVVQPGAREAGWDGSFGVHPGEFDVAAYARVLRALDLLVTIDSMPAHLAGALGVPTWTLLHHDPDWRWMQGRQDTPWYPGMRLLRQPVAGDWSAVLAQVATGLAGLGGGPR